MMYQQFGGTALASKLGFGLESNAATPEERNQISKHGKTGKHLSRKEKAFDVVEEDQCWFFFFGRRRRKRENFTIIVVVVR